MNSFNGEHLTLSVVFEIWETTNELCRYGRCRLFAARAPTEVLILVEELRFWGQRAVVVYHDLT